VNNFGRFTGEAGLGGVLDHLHYAKALIWFGLPAWPIAAWAVWKRETSAKALQLPLVAFLVMFAVLSAASSARTLYGLPMLVPLSLLAAGALPPRWLLRALEVMGFYGGLLAGLALWAAWIALVAGWRPSFLEAQSPGYVPHIPLVGVLAALSVTVVCIHAWRNLQPRMPTRWLAGVALAWGLAMTLWLPWLDHGKSYRGVIEDMLAHAAPGCIGARGLTEPQRAMFHYFAGIRAGGPADCPLLLVQTSSVKPPAIGEGWELRWHGTRPGDTKEFFWLYERVRSVAVTS
jgi:4-amino-4-deoxy-L-arabinose transferase-like glycosyltransferase